MNIKKLISKYTSSVCAVLLLLAVLLTTVACGSDGNGSSSEPSGNKPTSSVAATSSESDVYGSAAKDVGKGEVKFFFRITDSDGVDTLYRVYTDKKTVGEALQELNLIAGEQGAYGLYVKTVNGITADYDKDKTYWAFYVYNEETKKFDYATAGVDLTDIAPEGEYLFKIEK